MPSSSAGPGGPSRPHGSARFATYAAWASCCHVKSLQCFTVGPLGFGLVVVVTGGRVVVLVARRVVVPFTGAAFGVFVVPGAVPVRAEVRLVGPLPPSRASVPAALVSGPGVARGRPGRG